MNINFKLPEESGQKMNPSTWMAKLLECNNVTNLQDLDKNTMSRYGHIWFLGLNKNVKRIMQNVDPLRFDELDYLNNAIRFADSITLYFVVYIKHRQPFKR